jgi:hypothetical protein
MKSVKQLIMALATAATVSTVTAQTTNIILQTDFDEDAGQGNFSNDYGYCVAGSSSGSALTGDFSAITGGAGVDGTSANVLSPNYTLLPTDPNWSNPANTYVYAVAGDGTQFGAPMTPITPTANLSSLILSADLQVSGLLTNLTTADVTISKVQFFDADNDVLFDFTGDAGDVGSNYVHIAVPLSQLGYASDATDPITDFTNAAIVSSIASFTIEFTVQGLVGILNGNPPISPPFGFTSTGTLAVDNIELIQTGNILPTPTQEQLIWQANFDTTLPSADYGFSFRDGANDATGIVTTNITGGVGGSNSLEYVVDLSSWSTNPPVSYSGFGVGAQESPLPFQLTSSAKSSYKIYFSAKVGGIPAGNSTNVSAVADLLFLVPPGAESPSNGSPAVVLDLSPALTLTTNWQSFAIDGSSCPVGVNNGGSQALFNQYVSKVNEMKLQVATQGSPDIGAQFGYATNVTVDIDNVKVVEMNPGLPPVSVINTNNHVEVFWADPTTGGTAQLESATNVTGPYLDVVGAASGAASPYVAPAGPAQQFFRTVWVQ